MNKLNNINKDRIAVESALAEVAMCLHYSMKHTYQKQNLIRAQARLENARIYYRPELCQEYQIVFGSLCTYTLSIDSDFKTSEKQRLCASKKAVFIIQSQEETGFQDSEVILIELDKNPVVVTIYEAYLLGKGEMTHEEEIKYDLNLPTEEEIAKILR